MNYSFDCYCDDSNKTEIISVDQNFLNEFRNVRDGFHATFFVTPHIRKKHIEYLQKLVTFCIENGGIEEDSPYFSSKIRNKNTEKYLENIPLVLLIDFLNPRSNDNMLNYLGSLNLIDTLIKKLKNYIEFEMDKQFLLFK